MPIYYYSGNKKTLIKLALRYRLYVRKDWNLYRWLNVYKQFPPIDNRYSGMVITLAVDNLTPIGVAFSHIMFVGKDETPALDLNLYLKSRYKNKGIGSKMIEHHLDHVFKNNPNTPIMFNYGIMKDKPKMEHFMKKYEGSAFVFDSETTF